MKKYLLTIITVLFLVSSATSQHMNMAIKGGVNLYNIGNENSTAGDTKVGYHVGLLSHIHLAEDLAFQPEVLFSTQGAKYSSGNNDFQLNLNYINVPLLLQYMFDNGFRIEAGPQLGFLMSAKSEINNSQTDVKNDFKGIEVAFGFGVSYVSPASGLGIDARYNHGLTDINENNALKSYNSGFQIGLFYLFNHN